MENKNTRITRRNILKWAGGTFALGVGGSLFSGDIFLDPFDFLQRGEDGTLDEIVHQDNFQARSVPITELVPERFSPERKDALSLKIKARIEQFQLPIAEIALHDFGEVRYWVVPEPNSDYAQHYLHYCSFASQFLFSQTELGSSKPPLQWLLPYDEKIPAAIPGYVCLGSIREDRANAVFTFPNGQSDQRVISLPEGLGGGDFRGWKYILDSQGGVRFIRGPYVLIAGTQTKSPDALVVPYSEMMHLLSLEGIENYVREHSHDDPQELFRQVTELGELFSESAGLYVSAQSFNHPALQKAKRYTSAQELVKQGLELGDPQYADLPKAYGFLLREGLEKTRNLFQEKPSEYLERVRGI